MKTGVLDAAIKAHKYEGKWGWGIIFARVLLGHLAFDSEVSQVDAIIPMPKFNDNTQPRRGHDHAGWVIESAMDQDDQGYPFRLDPPLIIKKHATTRMVSTLGAGARRAAANELYDALLVPKKTAVNGMSVVVFDDVFTTGSTLNAVARRLREAGARRVTGLTLARAPWR